MVEWYHICQQALALVPTGQAEVAACDPDGTRAEPQEPIQLGAWRLERAEQGNKKSHLFHMQAAAAAAFEGQQLFLHEVTAVVDRLTQARAWKPLAFIEHVMFDETPMHLR
eukprot:5041575-Amphidinium_carterae.1